jgi:hypothetical protein
MLGMCTRGDFGSLECVVQTFVFICAQTSDVNSMCKCMVIMLLSLCIFSVRFCVLCSNM